jgi:23S rRNA (cytidine2498-2'-O)-methyltransferase
MANTNVNSLLLYCRGGFEKDLAVEIQDKAAQLGVYGFAKIEPDSGYVVFQCYQDGEGEQLAKQLMFSSLIFARQMFATMEALNELDTSDRLSPIVSACSAFPMCGDVRVEYADTTEGRELSKFCRKISVPLRQKLRKMHKLTDKEQSNKPVLHVFFTATDSAFVGYSYSNNNSPLPLGILRLKMPSDAPSRSTLKLDEAFQTFIPKSEQAERLRGSTYAVDLGACPGGWTYQLVKRSMFVYAVDNGAMDKALMDSGLVTYCPEDGFKFKAKKPIYWLVCDMIEQPQKVARLMAQWVASKRCKEAMFNLKLPMKKRYESVQESLAIIDDEIKLHHAGQYVLQVKHLYHNREEVTVHLRLI